MHDRRRRALVFASALSLLGYPAGLHGQRDSLSALHATLRGWEDDRRATIFDRSGSFHGRLSDRGILQRFSEQLDHEYTLDVVSFGFTLSEDYDWYTNRSGARWWGGSINHRSLVQRAEIAGRVALGETWDFDVLYTQANTLQASRSLVRTGFRKSLGNGRAGVFATGWLQADKPEMDVEVGVTLRPGQSSIDVAFALLDPFSDAIYQGLEVGPPIADQILDYRTQPFTVRTAMDLSLSPHVRAEVYGLYMFPADISVRNIPDTTGSFAQDERFGYAGALLEWAPSPHSAFGAAATWVEAQLNRSSSDQGLTPDDFDLTERNARLGVFGLQRVGRFLIEGWVSRLWRIEDRLRPDPAVADEIDYEDRSWLGRFTTTYRARSGFRAELGLDFVARTVRGDSDLPGGHLDGTNSRLRFDLGWYFGSTALFAAGTNADLDGDRGTATGTFDGGHARVQVFW